MPSIKFLALLDGHQCQRCESTKDLTRDHIWPRSKGGCNCVGNIQILCATCNRAKGDTHDGRGHTSEDCPQRELVHFMQRWHDVRKAQDLDAMRSCVEEVKHICEKLADYQCAQVCIQKAHSMVGTVKAHIRDFDKIQPCVKHPHTLEKLRRIEAKLSANLQRVREEISRQEKETQ